MKFVLIILHYYILLHYFYIFNSFNMNRYILVLKSIENYYKIRIVISTCQESFEGKLEYKNFNKLCYKHSISEID